MFDVVAAGIDRGARAVAAGAFVVSAIVALTHWGVRSGRLEAFGPWARFVRRWSDPLLHPLERRLARAGANPQDAPVWLVGVAVVGGLVLIWLLDWALGFVYEAYATAHGGYLALFLLRSAFELLKLALIVRVIGSWLGQGRYNRYLRLVYTLTDWLVEPIRRILPPFGILDFSPLVAYLVLYFAEELVLRAALR